MHECMLCERDMKKSKNQFGNGCINNIFKFLDIKKPNRCKSKEQLLYKSIMNRTSILGINKEQKIWLTDRYLTYQYLDKLHYGNFEKLKEQINTDIENVNKVEKFEEMITTKKMKLKEAYDLYKRERKFEDNLNKLESNDYGDEDEEFKLLIASFIFIFNMYGNKNQYEKSHFKAMQYAFWQTVIEVGRRYAKFTISADFLQHSLEEKPKDLHIIEGKVVDEIKKDNQFKEKINKIIDEYGKGKKQFIAKGDEISISFNNKDLYFSIHSANMVVKGNQNNEKWELDIALDDKYDYSKPKGIMQYYFDTKSIPKSIFSSTLYNLASASMKLGVMKEYMIYINFKINEDEVKQ